MEEIKNSYIKTLKFLIILNLIILTNEWDAKSLIRNKSAKDIIDPNSFLNENSSDFKEIKDLIFEIKDKNNIETKLIIFDKMNQEYKNNIEVFTDEIAFNLSHGNQERDFDMLIISISIDDRKLRIRTGKNIRNKLGDFRVKMILEKSDLKKYLKEAHYTIAAKFILKEIYDYLNSEFSPCISEDIISVIVLAFLSFIFFYSIYNIFKGYCCKNRVKTPKERLERIKKICEEKKSKKEFIEKMCIICLEDFKLNELEKSSNNDEKLIKNENKNNKNDRNEPLEIIKEDNVNSKNNTIAEKIQSKISEKEIHLKKEENEDFIAKLECGHAFHSKCIIDWMVRKNFCPLCKAKIDNEEDDGNYKTISQNLVDVQTEFYPELSTYVFDYAENSFTWTNPREFVDSQNSNTYIQDNGNENYSNESGGATGGW